MPHPTSTQHNPKRLDETLGEATSGASTQPRAPKTTLDASAKQAATQQLAALEELLSGSDPDAMALSAQIEAFEETMEHAFLPPGIQAAVPYVEYVSPAFAHEAVTHGFTPFQWAGVQGIVRQARPDKEVDPAAFSPAPDGRGLTVGGDLNLNHCTALKALPEGLAVERNLELTHCKALTALPAGLTVGRSLDLTGCKALTTLPAGLSVREDLNLSRCTALAELPKGLTVGRSLSLNACKALVTLPDGLTIGGYLELDGCTALATLPAGLTIGGSLHLDDCTVLTALPAGLTVGRDLFLRGCTAAVQDQGRALYAVGKIKGRLHLV